MHKSKESAAVAKTMAQTFTTPEERDAFERDVAKIVAAAELLCAFDDVRAGMEITKAELARRIGVKPSVVSRLLNGTGHNVTLSTIADVADALGLYVEVTIKRQPRSKPAHHAVIEVSPAL